MSMPQRAPQVAGGPKYETIYDIKAMFDKNPSKLVAYVETGIRRDVWLPGVHISQLASWVGIDPMSEGVPYKNLPASFIDPRNFDNIEAIVADSHKMFPDFPKTKVV